MKYNLRKEFFSFLKRKGIYIQYLKEILIKWDKKSFIYFFDYVIPLKYLSFHGYSTKWYYYENLWLLFLVNNNIIDNNDEKNYINRILSNCSTLNYEQNLEDFEDLYQELIKLFSTKCQNKNDYPKDLYKVAEMFIIRLDSYFSQKNEK